MKKFREGVSNTPAAPETSASAIDPSERSRFSNLFGKIGIGLTAALIVSACAESEPAEPAPQDTEIIAVMPTTPTETPRIFAPDRQTYPDQRFEPVASWMQDFAHMPDGPVDGAVWNTMIGDAPANQEVQKYTNNERNLRIHDGMLEITATKEGDTYTSARIDTLGKQSFMYGKFEIEAKLPSGAGTWPAVWMLSKDKKFESIPVPEGPNMYYSDGEFDVIEAIGTEPGRIYGIAHSLLPPDENEYPTRYFATKDVPTYNTEFHTYGLEWTPDTLSFSVDGEVYFSIAKKPHYDYKQWPYDQAYYLIANLAMGGSWASGAKDIYPPYGIDDRALPTSLQLRKIAYFPMKENEKPTGAPR